MIEVKNNITIPDVNKLYNTFNERVIKGQNTDLKLPKSIDKSDLGILFSFLQFVATWMRSPNSGNLYLPVTDQHETKDYLKKEFVYPSVVLAWEKKIFDLNNNNIRRDLKELSQTYFREMEFYNLPERLSVPIYCFDHDKRKSGHSRIFYDTNQKLLPEALVSHNLYLAYKKIGSFNKKAFGDSIKTKIDSFDSIIHELFSNTDEHARTDENGYNLYPNIRAVYLKFQKRPPAKFKEIYSAYPGLIDFFSSDFSLNPLGELYLLEISILDSGPGIVKRYSETSALPQSTNNEVEIIKSSLYRRNTSAKGLDKERKGLGLDKVLRTIDQNGFLRIKTGRVDVFRDMRRHRYIQFKNASEIELFDMQQNRSDKFDVHPEAQGTLISILFPISYTAE